VFGDISVKDCATAFEAWTWRCFATSVTVIRSACMLCRVLHQLDTFLLCRFVHVFIFLVAPSLGSLLPLLEHRAEFPQFLDQGQSIGLLGQVISSSQGLYLNTGQHKHRINAYTNQTSMPCAGFKPTIPASEREKTVHALERSATMTGLYSCRGDLIFCVNTRACFLWCSWITIFLHNCILHEMTCFSIDISIIQWV
jgi:hypothetical protein